jgi:hypothetical protein
MKSKTSRIIGLLVIALVNLFGLFSSDRFQEIRSVDAARLLLSGLLIGLAIAQIRLNRATASRS